MIEEIRGDEKELKVGSRSFVPVWNETQSGRIQKNAKVLSVTVKSLDLQGILNLDFSHSVKLRSSA